LRTPHHPLSGKTKHLKIGEYREGLVLSEAKEGLLVDIGVQQPALMRQKQYTQNQRLTLQIVNIGDYVEVQPVSRNVVPGYWGYRVRVDKRLLGQILQDEVFDLRVATARNGSNFKDVVDKISEKWHESTRILIAFGAPSRGLNEIAADLGLKLDELVDFTINTVPNQGTATVRTEEALIASLAILNIHFSY
jgi:predicted SPOUT superfamily RNA methylase MTH1